MRVARAAFFAGPALLLVAALALGASFVADRRHARRRAVADDDVDAPAPAPRREMPPRRPETWAEPPAPAPPPEHADSLRLRVDGPHGLRLRSVSITMAQARDDRPRPSDGDEDDAADAADGDDGDDGDDAETTTYEVDAEADGSFLIDELDPGRYDVTVSADGLADAHLAGVPSGAVGVHLVLARPAVLIGAVGAGVPTCAGLHLSVDQGEDTEEQDVDDDCAFSADRLERDRPARLRFGLDERDTEVSVPVPATGDPPPLCLAPPCASLPSALVVLFADGEGFFTSDVSLSWVVALSEDGSRGGTTTDTGPAVIAGLPAGARVHLSAAGDGQAVESDVTVPFGISEVVLTLPADAETADEEETAD